MAGNWKMNLNHIDAVGLDCEAGVHAGRQGLRPRAVRMRGDPAVHRPARRCRRSSRATSCRSSTARRMSPHDDGAYTGDISSSMLTKRVAAMWSSGTQAARVPRRDRRGRQREGPQGPRRRPRRRSSAWARAWRCARPASTSSTCWPRSPARWPASRRAGCLLVIAYEPIWAIGTGGGDPEDAQEVCGAIRAAVADLYDAPTGDTVRISTAAP